MPYIGRPIDAGDFKVLTLAESFNGVLVDFTLSESVGTPNQLIVILSGVIQHWTDAFSVDGTTLTFSSAPASGETIKILKLGSVLSSNVPTSESVGVAQLSKTGIAAGKVFKVNDAGNAWELGNASSAEVYGFVKNVREPYNIPRQKLPSIMFQTGDIEFIKKSTLFKGSISGEKVIPIVVKKYFDLDSLDDFKKAKK